MRGARVLVPFGRKKYYTGIVASLSEAADLGFEVKPVMALLDSQPIVRNPQLRFWEWMADYYLCTIGDVYKAAVPAGLKPESETYVNLNPDFEIPEGKSLPEREAGIMQALTGVKRMKLSELEAKSKGNVGAHINFLLGCGAIEISENVEERYRPRTEQFVALDLHSRDQEGVHRFFDLTRRSPQQERALLAFLDLSRFLVQAAEPVEVTKKMLLDKSGVSPAVIKAMVAKGIFRLYRRSVSCFNRPSRAGVGISPLSPPQREASGKVTEAFREKNVVLLHGVTGSGKTEIYAHLASHTLEAGHHVLFLVPEISLTTQLTDRLRAMFGERLVVYHSRFSDNERVEIWQRLLKSDAGPCIVLGARSAVFLPFPHLGLVIVDEEHESSFKQYDPAPRYNGRDAAIMLASMHGAKTLLGSATPAVETYYKATAGKYGLVSLTTRFGDVALPQTEVVDMKRQRRERLNRGIISAPLGTLTRRALAAGKQAIMFQNRRGFAPVVVCRLCGWTPKCVNCDVSPVYHKASDTLRCHYCGATAPLPALCPACGGNSVEVYGYGTERIAEEVAEVFTPAKIERMDLDSTRRKHAYQEIIDRFSGGETDILVGTQMVTKGLDFSNVEVVGVLNADTLLNFPDFRSDERAFNMLEQVAGRAGRRSGLGHVLIQTTNPGSPVLSHVVAHDYLGFYEEEIENRRNYVYPPFAKVINVYLKNRDRQVAENAAALLADALRDVFANRVLGPEKPFVGRVANYYLQQIMLKIEAGASMPKVKYILRRILESLARDQRIKSSTVYYDVDPI